MEDKTKKYCFYNENIPFGADFDELNRILDKKKRLLENYLDVSDSLYEESYISRANGFCTTKIAEDVVNDKISELQEQIAQLQGWIQNI